MDNHLRFSSIQPVRLLTCKSRQLAINVENNKYTKIKECLLVIFLRNCIFSVHFLSINIQSIKTDCEVRLIVFINHSQNNASINYTNKILTTMVYHLEIVNLAPNTYQITIRHQLVKPELVTEKHLGYTSYCSQPEILN